MARGVRKKGSGREPGGRRGSREGPKFSGIEKYGQDDADEFLKLDADDESCDAASSMGGEEGEVDVMALEESEDAEARPGKKKSKRKTAVDDGPMETETQKETNLIDLKGSTKGWRGGDFYGGDDAGDDSEGGSEEDMTFEEARKLEEIRVKRLQGREDPLSALLAPINKKQEPESAQEDAPLRAAAGFDAKFEAIFASEAERSSLGNRDLAQLPETKRRGLLKTEAPELVPLLEDFQKKIAALRRIRPLLEPKCLTRFPASGASYLQAKASLLLSTLANLSFYLLMRAEGGPVRDHPVVSQLVWLREIHEDIRPLDETIEPKLKRAIRQSKAMLKSSLKVASGEGPAEATTSAAERVAEMPAAPRQRLSIRERLERLRAAGAAECKEKSTSGGARVLTKTSHKEMPSVARREEPSTDDLLRLPSRRRRGGSGTLTADAPADLDDVDPSVGVWRPGITLGEQLSVVQQQLRERRSGAEASSADFNVEARTHRAREQTRASRDPVPDLGNGREEGPGAAAELEGSDEDAIVKKAVAAALAKKEKRARDQAAREDARLAGQYHPDEVLDGRRKTSQKILKNRGLVRERKKDAGNARVHNRNKFDKMVKRRKGAVQEMREAAADGATYEGEATGVRANVRKSQKLS